jgi:hypothetical protein
MKGSGMGKAQRLEKLPDAQLNELTALGSDRTGDAAMTVLQLIDDPGQAAAVAAVMATNLMRLAALFAHTDNIMKGGDKPHSQIVAGLVLQMAQETERRPPGAKQLERIRRLKERFGL